MHTPYSRLLATIFTAVAVSALSTRAADVNQSATAAAGQSWATAAIWSDNSAASAGNHYFTNGYTLRTPDSPSGSTTFPGASLTVNDGLGGARGNLSLKAATTTIGDLKIGIGTVSNNVSGGSGNLPATLNVTNLTVLSAATSSNAAILQGTNTAQDLTVNVTNLSGSGYLQFSRPRAYSLSVTNASAFTGTLNLGEGNLTLSASLSMGGGAFSMASSGATLILSNDLSVASFSFGATTLTDSASYTSAQLNALFSTSAFSGAGLVNVGVIPEPSAYALGAGVWALAVVGLRRRGSR